MNPRTPEGAAYVCPASPAQERWRAHLASCYVCFHAPSGDVAALCNRGRACWQDVEREQPPAGAVEHGANHEVIVPIDVTEPYRVRVTRGRR